MIATFFTILPVFLIIAVGYGAAKGGLVPEGASRALNRFVVWLALPALMFDVVGTTDWTRLWHTGFVMASLLGSFVLFGLGMLIGRWRGLTTADMAVDGLNASYANSAYIGLPLLTLVLGQDTRPYIIIAATLTLMALLTAATIIMELGKHHGSGWGRALGHAVVGVVRNPVLVGSLAGALWWVSGFKLPLAGQTFFSLLGNAASPTALAAIGMFLAERPISHAFTDRNVLALSAAKLVLHPALTAWLAWKVFMLPPAIAVTAIAVAALPTGTGPFMAAEIYARDGRVTSGTILISTIASVITLAAILSLLT